jgi:hypothetical protein
MQETYNQGRILALEEIEKIKEFLKIWFLWIYGFQKLKKVI